MEIYKVFEKGFKIAEERNWDSIFIGIDIHDTILKPNYGGVSTEYYPHAKKCLQLLSERKDTHIFIWTCSHPEDAKFYQDLFAKDGINFPYINENPMVINTKYGNFDKKPYANVIIDDKSGFEPSEWEGLYNYLIRKKEIEL